VRPTKQFFVYVMTNGPKSAVLYTGVTGNLPYRVWQHRNKLIPSFTSRHNLTQLVYYDRFVYPDAAISREKEIKSCAAQQEDKTHRGHESEVGRPGEELGR
jgi:putative endonuclease